MDLPDDQWALPSLCWKPAPSSEDAVEDGGPCPLEGHAGAIPTYQTSHLRDAAVGEGRQLSLSPRHAGQRPARARRPGPERVHHERHVLERQ